MDMYMIWKEFLSWSLYILVSYTLSSYGPSSRQSRKFNAYCKHFTKYLNDWRIKNNLPNIHLFLWSIGIHEKDCRHFTPVWHPAFLLWRGDVTDQVVQGREWVGEGTIWNLCWTTLQIPYDWISASVFNSCCFGSAFYWKQKHHCSLCNPISLKGFWCWSCQKYVSSVFQLEKQLEHISKYAWTWRYPLISV